jgi:glyoxylase-like metal-dependent hydrolase (beta-lactamase superfamily II)
VGIPVSCYLRDGVLVDTGFAHARAALVGRLAGVPLEAILLTHHHEDHAANAGELALGNGCPVYLRNPGTRHGEGLDDLPFYRRLSWGRPGPYEPTPTPEVVEAVGRRLRAVPIPGHSSTHTAYLDEGDGSVFTGDLYVARGATAVMAHENPFESIASLRRVAALAPTRMLTGHGLCLENPAAALEEKAAQVEEAAGRVLELHRQGRSADDIARAVFPGGWVKDKAMQWFTAGEFSRACFVRAVIRHGS